MKFTITIGNKKIVPLDHYEVVDIEPGSKNYYIDDKLVPTDCYLWHILNAGEAVLLNQYIDAVYNKDIK